MGAGTITTIFAVSGMDRKDLPSNPPVVTRTVVSLGLVGLGVGGALVISGARARVRFDRWRADTQLEVRKDGSGLISGGATLTAFASATIIGMSVSAARYPDALDYNQIPAMLGVSSVGLAAGVSLLSWGIVRRGRYVAWRDSSFVARTTPMVIPLPRGAGLGLVGRF
jgi:hypothetical protein